ncbi:hypothetical protein [Mycoplasmopsis primatum]|uniref:hypothetical protein n=1 Tax=Mycoplasmopsis primatum TaxID=55604 RepID=UPI0004958C70|nr:hypothetical protein [Mycoplasmopsis primatum]
MNVKQTLIDQIKNLPIVKINSFLSEIDGLEKSKKTILKSINDNEIYFKKYDFNSTKIKEKIANIIDSVNLNAIEQDVTLEIKRYNALSQIDDIKNLSNDAKNNYKKDILKSNNIDKIDLIIKRAMKVSGVGLKKAIARVEVDKLQFISQDEKKQFKEIINNLDTVEKVDDKLNLIIHKNKNKENIYNEKIKVSVEFEEEYIESVKQKFIDLINENDYQKVAFDFFHFNETKKLIKKELQELLFLSNDDKLLLLQELKSFININDAKNLRDYQVNLDKAKHECFNKSLVLTSIEWDKSKSGSKYKDIKQHIINAKTVEMLDKIFSQLVYADDVFKAIRDSFSDADDAKYNISQDEREGFLKKVVISTKEEIDKLLIQFNDLVRSKENERLNYLSTHLELKLKTYDADIIMKKQEALTLNDFDNNVMNQKFISLSEISKQYDADNKVLTFTLKLESNRFDGKSIFLHKDLEIKIASDVYDIEKSYKQQHDFVINGYKTGQSYQDYRQNIISNIDKIENEIKTVNPKCKPEVVAKIKEQHNIFSQKIEDSFLACAYQSISEFMKFTQDNQQLNIDIYNHLNSMFANTNKELLDVFAKLGKSEKKTSKGLLYQMSLARDWVLAETVGKWATSIFTNLFNSNNVFERVIDLSFDRLKAKYSLSDEKALTIVKVSKRILLHMLSYFKDLKWDYLIHGNGKKQDEYDNKKAGKIVLLTGGWSVLFDTEKFLVSKYSDPSGKDLDTELQSLVTQKIITDDEKLIFFKEIKYILSPFTKSIDNYNRKIKETMISGLASSFKIINDAK